MKNIALVFLCLLFSAEMPAQISTVLSNNKLKTATDSVVDKAAQTFMSAPERVGLSIGIYKNDKFYKYHYGETEKGKRLLPDDKTLYAIASISKTFISALLAQAVLDKKVRKEDDVRKYLDGYYANLEYLGRPITLLDLTNHRSGLPFSLPDVPEIFADTTLSQADVANKLSHPIDRKVFYEELHKVKLDTIPGRKFRYSNAAVILLGFILERVYEMPLEKLLRDCILQPLQMNNTKIALSAKDENLYAKGYDYKGNVVSGNTEALQGAGGIKSTLSDMLTYVKWNAEEKDDMVKLAHWPFWATTWNAVNKYAVGLNWQILQTNGYRVVWQEGNVPGYNSYCVVYPELKMGITVLTNESDKSSSSHITEMINQIVKSMDDKAIALPQ